MICITSLTYDPNGVVILYAAKVNNPYSANRRGSVVDTLDGLVSVYDTGFSESDQTLTIDIVNPSLDILQKLKYLISHYSQVSLSCEAGVFKVILATAINKNKLNISARIIAKMDGTS